MVKEAESQGWQVLYTNGGHYKWIPPSGKFFFSASTPSDPRSIKNIKRDLRVNGLILITKKKGNRR